VALGQLAYEVSFEGVVTAYRYDNSVGSGGRLAAKHYYGGATAEADYLADAADGTLIQADEATTYTYDAQGRSVDVVQDRDGNLTTTTDQRVTTNDYDGYGRLTSVALPEGTINYEYNAVTGERVRTWTGTTSVDTDTWYDYDALGRLDEVRALARNGAPIDNDPVAPGNQAEATDYVYDLLGNLKQTRLPNGVVSDYDYDSLNRLEFLRQFRDTNGNGTYQAGVDAVLAEFDYDLLADGRRSGVTEKDDQGRVTRIDWLYDSVGRLTRESYNSFDDSLDFIARYRFELTGNRREKASNTSPTAADFSAFFDTGALTPDETVTYTYDANDRLLTETKDMAGTTDDRRTIYSYGTGNAGTQQTGKEVRRYTDGSGGLLEQDTYGYNLQGRMSSATVDKTGSGGGTSTSTYQYDDSGIRVSQTVDGQKTDYLIDAFNPTGYAQVIEEKIADAILKSYTLGLDVIGQQGPGIANGSPLFFLYDGHGSTRGLVDATGQPLVGQVFRYDAYGNRLDVAVALTNLLYSGEQIDNTGLHYLRARYYDPSTGRFNRLDPLAGTTADPISLHRYLYANGDPANIIDPSGLSSEPLQLSRTA